MKLNIVGDPRTSEPIHKVRDRRPDAKMQTWCIRTSTVASGLRQAESFRTEIKDLCVGSRQSRRHSPPKLQRVCYARRRRTRATVESEHDAAQPCTNVRFNAVVLLPASVGMRPLHKTSNTYVDCLAPPASSRGHTSRRTGRIR